MIGLIGDIIKENVTVEILKAFLGFVKEQYENELDKNALNKSCEGILHESIGENLKRISEGFSSELTDVNAYTESELRSIFDLYYKEYVLCGISNDIGEDIREELWKRFMLFVPKWLEKYNKSISFGEKRILEKTREIQETINELVVVDKEILKELAEHQSKLLIKLAAEVDVPYIDLNKMYGIQIGRYESKYIFFENTFDFDRTEDRNDVYKDITYIFQVLIKNIGRKPIEKIAIENFRLFYAEEMWDDNPESGFYLLPIMEHADKIEKCISIMPDGEEYVRLVVTDRVDELSEEERVEEFLDEYQYERLYVTFDIWLKGVEDRGYSYILFLSKRGISSENLEGTYSIDYSVFTEL